MTDFSGPPNAAPPGWRPPPPPLPPPPGWQPVPPAAPRTRAPLEPDPAPVRLLLLCLAAGVLLELGLRGGPANALVALGGSLVVVGLVTDGRLRKRSARVVVAGAIVPLAFLGLRASHWLVASNLVAAALLVAAGLAFSRSGSLLDTTVGRFAFRLVGTLPRACSAPRLLGPALPRLSATGTKRAGRVVLALAICVPVLAVLVGLLASADPVFAGLLTPDLSVGPSIGHVVLALLLSLVAVCVIGAAASDTTDRDPHGRFGALEITTMLVLTASVLGLFVVAQLIAATSAGDRLVARAGLTPAEYARSGFFQLCWATGLVLALLAGIRSLAAPGVMRAPVVRALAALVPCLALGLVAVSLRRMALYDDAFGLTMLRLWVLGTAVWMGVVLLLVAARNAGLGAHRDWVLGVAGAVAVAFVLVADVANPEALVVRHNVDRARDGADLDVGYLVELSDDAVPAVAAALDAGGAPGAGRLPDALRCRDRASGARAVNLAVQRADAVRDEACAEVLAS